MKWLNILFRSTCTNNVSTLNHCVPYHHYSIISSSAFTNALAPACCGTLCLSMWTILTLMCVGVRPVRCISIST
jgi:hypothetical protein